MMFLIVDTGSVFVLMVINNNEWWEM